MNKTQKNRRQEFVKAIHAKTVAKVRAAAAIADCLPEGKGKREAQRVRANLDAAAPLIREIREFYPNVAYLDDLTESTRAYPQALPALLSWLPRVSNLAVKQAIVHVLTNRWAGRVGVHAVFDELRHIMANYPESKERDIRLSMMAGNLVRVLDQNHAKEIAEFVRDPATPKDVALTILLSVGKIREPAITREITKFLHDPNPDVIVTALRALRRAKDPRCISALDGLSNHKISSVRKEAEKTRRVLEQTLRVRGGRP